MKNLLAASALTLILAACSPASTDAPATDNVMVANETVPLTPVDPGTPTPATGETADANTLTLEGLGALKVGQPVPEDSGWAVRGAQISDACTTISSPDYPGVYAIVTDGAVHRISVGQRSDVKLIEGIGPGSTEAEVKAAFPGFRETPHKYVEGGKYLTAPNADSGDPAVRFELDADGKVTVMHVGTMPVLGYVEGCA